MITVDRKDLVSSHRTQIVLGVGALVAYAVGYPIAIVGGSAIGWALVSLGGVLLLALGVITIQRIQRSTSGT